MHKAPDSNRIFSGSNLDQKSQQQIRLALALKSLISTKVLLLISALLIALLFMAGGSSSFATVSVLVLWGCLVGITLHRFVLQSVINKTEPLESSRRADLLLSLGAVDEFPALKEILSQQRNSEMQFSETIEAMEEEIAMLVERYQLLTDNLAAAVVIRDDKGTITYCSRYTEVLSGYPLKHIYDFEGDFLSTIVHEEDRDQFTRAFQMTNLGEHYQFRYRFFHRSGMEMWAETRTVPVLSEQGELMFSLSITIDVTGSVRYQQQVEEKNKDLQDFTYMVSHDLKAPISTIKGMATLIEEDFGKELPEDMQEPLNHITEASHRLELLVQSVIEYSKVSTSESIAEPIELSEVLEDVANDYKPQLEQVGGSVEIHGTLPRVLGDQIKLYQIFSNLIGNALKYRDKQRNLKIDIEVRSEPNTRRAIIEVKDNGLGIPEDRIDHIFRPFQRAHGNEVEGSGIGLACVKRLAEKLGGGVSVESTENQGSSFIVSLRDAPKPTLISSG